MSGIVQGVGFRPFVIQLAYRFGLNGSVCNDGRGVTIEAQGDESRIEAFIAALRSEAPPLAQVQYCRVTSLSVADVPVGFVILESNLGGGKSAAVAPDAHVCDDCLRELFDPSDRRHGYPFINCTNCGPRFSLITGIPYDRPRTTMADFTMCTACDAEYHDPLSRRYHAQPIACPECGPQLDLRDADGQPLAGEPLTTTIALLQQGRIVAIKGVGGYHLAVDPANSVAVAELRRRKRRDEKPFALMASSLAEVAAFALVSDVEARLLTSVERPIVLLEQCAEHGLAAGVAPGNRYFGVMLAYTPLHYLLLRHGGFPCLIMTSANRSDEPIVYRDAEVAETLTGIVDAVLTHNRRIHIRCDDSIARIMAGEAVLLRRARGYVPRSLALPSALPAVLALGGELKNTLCFTREDRAFLSQHLGDLANEASRAAHGTMIDHLRDVLELTPRIIAHDLHPDYFTTRCAEVFSDLRRIAVQHHHAHFASCLAENNVVTPAIGVIFDGTGYGPDGHIWGGEFLLGDLRSWQRVGRFAELPLPGGDAAIREPWRMALSALHAAYGSDLPPVAALEVIAQADRRLLLQMIERRIQTPLTSSCGRLFDAVAALCGVRNHVSYEGQAALELEMLAQPGIASPYPYALPRHGELLVFDPRPLLRAIVADLQSGVAAGAISARFHATIAALVTEVCCALRVSSGLSQVALSGGVFQNRLLTEQVVALLHASSFTVYTHRLVPPNDGGLALGQAVVAGFIASE